MAFVFRGLGCVGTQGTWLFASLHVASPGADPCGFRVSWFPGFLDSFMLPVPVSASMLHLGGRLHIFARVSPLAQKMTVMQTQIYGTVLS